MLNFSKKLYGLAGAVTMFTGMAFGQITCASLAPSSVSFIRAEGQTERLSDLTLACSNSGSVAGSLTVTLYLTPTVSITSPVVTTSTGATTATATPTGGGTAVPGVVNAGSSLVFSQIVTPASGAFTVTLTNIRVNATQIPTVAGAAPTAIAAQAFVSGTNVTPGNTGTAGTVAFVTNGLLPSKFGSASGTTDSKILLSGSTATSFGVCASINNSSTSGSALPNFYVTVSEGFQQAFKTQADEKGPLGSTDVAASGTRIKFVYSNIPSGLNIYMPISVSLGAAPATAITATTSETGALSAQTAVTSPAQFSGLNVFQVPVSNGTAVAVYEVTQDNGQTTTDLLSVPVYLQGSSNSVVSQASSLSLQTSLAPVTAATTVPSFVTLASSSPSLNILSFTQCTTSLLFPFVTNVAGFETGIAIDNTTKDPFGAKAQSGSCTLSFYGTSATNPTSGPAPNPNEGGTAPYLAGESYAFTLTSALQAASSTNPATFQGYMIASCNFQLAHGFAYITYGFPGTSSSTMGYLALVLNNRGTTSAEAISQ